MKQRPRRLRRNEVLRNLVRETRISPKSLIYPLFIEEGLKGKVEISAMPGQYRYGLDTLLQGVEDCVQAGVQIALLFGIPKEKDALGSSAWAEDGVIQQAIALIHQHYPDFFIITDVCMCEYTSHGHCGELKGDTVDNDKTLALLNKVALSHAKAGADMVAPSDMMDGRIGSMREALDKAGYSDLPILSYSAKYASGFYGPFREAADSTPAFGDRKTYQMDYHNSREALFETALDLEQGADMIMVKPALSYLDVIAKCHETFDRPLCAYSVSGEYSMIKAAAAAGMIDEHRVMCETAVSIFRAGADMLITYYAKELALAMKQGEIG